MLRPAPGTPLMEGSKRGPRLDGSMISFSHLSSRCEAPTPTRGPVATAVPRASQQPSTPQRVRKACREEPAKRLGNASERIGLPDRARAPVCPAGHRTATW
jgi:hypothetical protein